MAKPTVWDEKFNLRGGALLLHCFCTQLPTSQVDWMSNWIACTKCSFWEKSETYILIRLDSKPDKIPVWKNYSMRGYFFKNIKFIKFTNLNSWK